MLLEQRLNECSAEDGALAPLSAQWGFDKRLISKALQSVGNLFPHYSRHDESHSRQILINIERILGPSRISQMSGTDVWLLLEAAYLHDIGMVVTQQEKELDWKSPEFRSFVASQRFAFDGSLPEDLVACLDDPMRSLAKSEDPLGQIAKISQLLAEFYRRKHADRASLIANQPVETIGLNSPRNELISKRLFYLLGEICAMHGKGHAEIMQLPAVASGLGKDKIHPRFVACMLRLGDLLDLDDNRFCPVMLNVAGPLPASTHAHIEKHHAIRHLRIDTERIEVHAVCSTYDGYVESEKWFDYIRKEVAWQMAHWADIVPDNRFGLLPTIGNITTELKGYELIDNISRPHFELDQPRVLELLQGAGLYVSINDALRELLQNAIDATLLYVWLKHGEGEGNDSSSESTIKRLDGPYDEKVTRILNKYPLSISIDRPKEGEMAVPAFVRLRIQDSGVGISRDDVKGMAKVGRSIRGSWKESVYERMPVWMRPSGAFGIGLQSAFILADEILFRTKSIAESDELIIRMTNPVGAEEGSIYIKREKATAIARRCGTLLELNIPLEKERGFGVRRLASKFYDPLVKSPPLYFDGIVDNVPLPVIINGELQRRELCELKWHYHPEPGIAVAFNLASESIGWRYYFKGQRVRHMFDSGDLPCEIHVNVFGQAASILSVNRSEFRNSDVTRRFIPAVVSTARELIASDLPEADKAMLSAVLLALGSPYTSEYLGMEWRKGRYGERRFVWPRVGEGVAGANVGTLIDCGDFYQMFGDFSPRYIWMNNEYLTCSHDSISLLLRAVVHQGYRGYMKSVEKKGVVIGVAKDREAWGIDELVKLFLANLTPGLRLALPTNSQFKGLASIKWRKFLGESSRAIFCPGWDYMYSPFIIEDGRITTNNFDELVSWTYENRHDRAMKLDGIRSLYIEFIETVDAGMGRDEKWLAMRRS